MSHAAALFLGRGSGGRGFKFLFRVAGTSIFVVPTSVISMVVSRSTSNSLPLKSALPTSLNSYLASWPSLIQNFTEPFGLVTLPNLNCNLAPSSVMSPEMTSPSCFNSPTVPASSCACGAGALERTHDKGHESARPLVPLHFLGRLPAPVWIADGRFVALQINLRGIVAKAHREISDAPFFQLALRGAGLELRILGHDHGFLPTVIWLALRVFLRRPKRRLSVRNLRRESVRPRWPGRRMR